MMKKSTGYLLTGLGLLLLAGGLYLIKAMPDGQAVAGVVPYLLVGIGCGLFGHGVGNLCNAAVLRRDPQLAQQQEFAAKDERNVTLSNMARARGFNAMTYVFAVLMLAYGLMGVDFSVLIPFVLAYLGVQFYAVYCRLQLEKQL